MKVWRESLGFLKKSDLMGVSSNSETEQLTVCEATKYNTSEGCCCSKISEKCQLFDTHPIL